MYISIRDAMGLVIYELEGFGYILARANNMLNYRRVLGFKILGPGSNKRCDYVVVKRWKRNKSCDRRLRIYYVPTTRFRCRGKAAVGVFIQKGSKKYMIYLCPTHFKKFLDSAVKYVKDAVEKAYSNIAGEINTVNPLAGLEDVALFFQGEEG